MKRKRMRTPERVAYEREYAARNRKRVSENSKRYYDLKRERANGLPPRLGYCYACHAPEHKFDRVFGKGSIHKVSSLHCDHAHGTEINRGWLCKVCNTHEGFYASGALGPMAEVPRHLREYLRRFSNGWDVGEGLSELLAESKWVRALGFAIE